MPATQVSLLSIRDDMYLSMVRMRAYHFFWVNLFQILRTNEEIRDHFETACVNRENGYRMLFGKLLEDHLVLPESFKGEYSCLIERLIDFSNTWIYASHLYQDRILDERFIQDRSMTLLSMLFPYLTKTGQKAYHSAAKREFPACEG